MSDLQQPEALRPRASAATPAWGFSCSFCDLPPELLEKARARLRFVALIFFWFCFAAILIEALLGTDASRVLYGVYVVNGLASAAVFALCRDHRVPLRAVLHFGLVYEVVICAVVSVGFPLAQYRATGGVLYVTWASIIIVAFPLLIPSPPMRTLIAALAAAATVPLGLVVLQVSGAVQVPALHYLEASLTPSFCVVLAYASSRVVYGLGLDVAKARELGSYRLVELLGKGGMGDVWRAEHKMLARPAAVKLISDQAFAIAGGRAVERFEREARATAFLESQHTIDIYDFGFTDEGSFYYAMELLDGVDLESLVRDFGPAPPERVVHILSGACKSLAEAHERKLIHRDVKPTNIFLCRKGLDYDFVKVLDFGLVKPAIAPAGDAIGLTAAGNILGTPAYIAPEMALGKQQIDGRADLYALGCVAFWLCTGTLVFEAESPVGVLMHHVQEPPPQISERCETEVPAQLKEIVQDCLAKDPNDRPRSATEVDERLSAIPFDDPWTPERAEAWWQLHLPDRTLAAQIAAESQHTLVVQNPPGRSQPGDTFEATGGKGEQLSARSTHLA